MTPPPAKKPEKSGKRGDWKKPASDRNQYHFSVFFKLPPEIRLMIYSDLIQSGNLEVLRLCQKIHGEAIRTIHQDGIYRVITKEAANLYFGDAALPGAQHEINRIREEVQNVEVYTDLKNFTSFKIRSLSARFPDIGDVIQEFKYPKISGKNCWVYLTEYDMIREPHTRSRLEIVLRAVQQFDNVFLNFHGSISQFYGNLSRFYDPSDFLWMEPTANFESHPKILRVKSVASFESEFEILRKELEPKFGPPTWLNSPDPMKRYWIFHPRQACPEGYLTTQEMYGKRRQQRCVPSWLLPD